MSIADDIKKALDLDAKATKGPWRWDGGYTNSRCEPTWSLVAGAGYGVLSCDIPNSPQGMGNHSNSDLIASYRDLAPRLAAWAQQVMPLVEAAEELKEAEPGRMTPEWMSRYQDAVAKLLDAALALNLEVPT